MRAVNPSKVIILSVLLAVTAFLVHARLTSGLTASAKPALDISLQAIPGWYTGADQTLDKQICTWLNLDDYLLRNYHRGSDTVTLYIGYYRSAAKVGAAHDPTVCFNGQGWLLSNPSRGSYKLAGSPDLSVDYSAMTAERNSESEMIVYWFQTNGKASSSTLEQKIVMVRDRLNGAGEDNAFVRITTPVTNGNKKEARKRIFEFIEAFYPQFHNYVTGS
jgi:EpsI family protein